jgi:hypothetical protein
MDAHDAPRLVLEDERRAVVAASAPENAEDDKVWLTLGTDAANQYVATGPHASRFHARIERHRNDFYLVDESTNGTYVQTEDETVQHVHRGRLRLWGSGWIGLGEPLHTTTPIHYRHSE